MFRKMPSREWDIADAMMVLGASVVVLLGIAVVVLSFRVPVRAPVDSQNSGRYVVPVAQESAGDFARWEKWFSTEHKPHCAECQAAFDRMENAMCVEAFERLQSELRKRND